MEGERLYAEGDFEGTLLAVDRVARRLAAEPARGLAAARALALLGAAYLGLGQDAIAESKFRQALQRAPGLRLSEDRFPPRVLKALEAARAGASRRRALETEASRKTGKTPWVLLGLGGAGATGLAVALKGERANTAPTASVSVAPGGQAMIHATIMTFSVSATDPEGDPLSYAWNFGDGSSGGGPTATHVYTRDGTFQVTVRVNDGLTETTASTVVTARALTGRWRLTTPPIVGASEFDLQQFGNGQAGGRAAGTDANATCRGGGTVTNPRGLSFDFKSTPALPCVGVQGQFNVQLTGEVDASLQTLNGSWRCHGGISGGAVVCRAGDGGPFTLIRQ